MAMLAGLVSHWKTVLIVSTVFLVLSVYLIWTTSKEQKDRYVDNKEYVSSDADVTQAYLYYFYTEWCPHCKATTAPWNALKRRVAADGGKVNGVVINFSSIASKKNLIGILDETQQAEGLQIYIGSENNLFGFKVK